MQLSTADAGCGLGSDQSDRRQPTLQSRFPVLDGVRGLAVLMVLVWHLAVCQLVSNAGSWAPYFRRLFSVTGSGVDLFFALSGFLIVGILLDRKGGQDYFRVFYVRRICRIFPLYFLLLVLCAVVSGWAVIPAVTRQWLLADPLPMWSYATFTQNFFMGLQGRFGPNGLAVTWSLAVEEQFYLVVPLLVWLLGKRSLAVAMIVALMALPCLRLLTPGFHGFVNLPWRADPLLTGACAAMLVRSVRCTQLVLRLQHWVVGVGCILMAAVGVMILFPGSFGVFERTLYGLLYGIVILIARLDLNRWACALLQTRVLCWMGRLSYGIYMFHQVVSGCMHGFIKGQEPRIAGIQDAYITLGSVVVTLMLAWMSYRFFEEPILRFGHRFKYSTKRH